MFPWFRVHEERFWFHGFGFNSLGEFPYSYNWLFLRFPEYKSTYIAERIWYFPRNETLAVLQAESTIDLLLLITVIMFPYQISFFFYVFLMFFYYFQSESNHIHLSSAQHLRYGPNYRLVRFISRVFALERTQEAETLGWTKWFDSFIQ